MLVKGSNDFLQSQLYFMSEIGKRVVMRFKHCQAYTQADFMGRVAHANGFIGRDFKNVRKSVSLIHSGLQ